MPLSSAEAEMRRRDREKRELTRTSIRDRSPVKQEAADYDRSPVKRESNHRHHKKRDRRSSSNEEISWEEEQRLYERIKEEAEDTGYDIKIKEEPLDRNRDMSGAVVSDERHNDKRSHRHRDGDNEQREEKSRDHHKNTETSSRQPLEKLKSHRGDDLEFRRPDTRGRQPANVSRDVRPPHNDRQTDRDSDRDLRRNRDEEGERSRSRDRVKYETKGRERDERRDRDRFDERESQTDRDRRNLFEQRKERYRNDRQRLEHRAERGVDNERGASEVWGRGNNEASTSAEAIDVKKEKEKPTLELSGKLADDTNVFRGVVIKYQEPEEARKPKKRWRFHPFKGDEALPILHLHRQSAFLLGRDRKIADIPVDHPSCSKQHAVLQFRLVGYKKADGTTGRRVSPYIIDLGSANGTYVNNQRIEAQRYVELLEKDVIKFGFSSRDYVLLHDSSDTSEITGEDEGVA